jgi:hypothetical protein
MLNYLSTGTTLPLWKEGRNKYCRYEYEKEGMGYKNGILLHSLIFFLYFSYIK